MYQGQTHLRKILAINDIKSILTKPILIDKKWIKSQSYLKQSFKNGMVMDWVWISWLYYPLYDHGVIRKVPIINYDVKWKRLRPDGTRISNNTFYSLTASTFLILDDITFRLRLGNVGIPNHNK